jgi:hypothetical protein
LARRIAVRGAPPQPNGEFRANKSKEKQIKPRKFAWISLDSFGRFGAFQWVTANPNKKILFACGSRFRLRFSTPDCPRRNLVSISRKYTEDFDCSQDFVAGI